MELIPGVKINELTTNEELSELEKEIAQQKAEAEASREARTSGLLIQVGIALSKGIPVEITEEMKELGLENKIKAMRMDAAIAWKLNKYLLDDEDFDNDDPGWFLG